MTVRIRSPLFVCAAALCLASCGSGARSESGIVATVPFELYMNQIFFRAAVNGSEPLWFLLDSGADDTTVTERTARELGFPVDDRITDYGYVGGDGTAEISVLNGVTLRFGGISAALKKRVIAVPFDLIEAVAGRRIDGVAGSELFENYAIKIDFTNRLLKFYDPEKYRYSGTGTIVPVGIHGVPYAKTYVALKDGRKIECVFMIDSGSAGALSFTAPFAREHGLFAVAGRTIPGIGTGGGGSSPNVSCRIGDIVIGTHGIKEPVVSLANASEGGGMARSDIAGILGNEILRRFTVVFDYRRSRMILEPNERINDRHEADMSGMFLYAKGARFDELRVYDVMPGSPADRAGIVAGDILDSIDGKSVRTLTLDEVRKTFMIDGEKYRLGIIRNGEDLSADIQVERMI